VERLRPAHATWIVQRVGDWQSLLDGVMGETQSLSLVEVERDKSLVWMRRIATMSRLGANRRIAVIGKRDIRSIAPALREAGAIWVGTSLSQQHPLVNLIERFADGFPPLQLPLREAVFAALPWTPGNHTDTMEPESSPDERTSRSLHHE
jgi:hypothetical protein